jgi:hypothetical protein
MRKVVVFLTAMVLCLAGIFISPVLGGELVGTDDSGNRNAVSADETSVQLTIFPSSGDRNTNGGHQRFSVPSDVGPDGKIVSGVVQASGGESVTGRMDFFDTATGAHEGTEFATATLSPNGVGAVVLKFNNPTKAGTGKLCAFQVHAPNGGFLLPAWTNEVYWAKKDVKHPTGHRHKLMAVVAGEAVSSAKPVVSAEGWVISWTAHQDLIREAQKKGGGGLKSVDDL